MLPFRTWPFWEAFAGGSKALCSCFLLPALGHAQPGSQSGTDSISILGICAGWPAQSSSLTLRDFFAHLWLRRPASPPPLLPTAPQVEEAGASYYAAASAAASDDDESSTTEGSEANRMLCRADTVDAMFNTGYDEDEDSADPMENLSLVIGNLVSAAGRALGSWCTILAWPCRLGTAAAALEL
jgi:hypothetical protein